jgi:hypothetical protein
MSVTLDDERAIRELLAPLAGVEPVSRRRRRRKAVAAANAIALVLLTLVGIAAADGFGPFAGIGAADRATTPGDALDPSLVADIERFNSEGPAGYPVGKLLPDTARLVSTLPSGKRIYVLTTTTNELCVLIQSVPGSDQDSGTGCGSPLTQAQPTTEESVQPNEQTPPLSFGVARDDVVAVSFTAGGVEKTIPVIDNVWAYEGTSSILESLTVHFRDGTVETLAH